MIIIVLLLRSLNVWCFNEDFMFIGVCYVIKCVLLGSLDALIFNAVNMVGFSLAIVSYIHTYLPIA